MATLARLTVLLAELGLRPKPVKTRIVQLTAGGEGVDFLGFHHRLVRSRAVPGRAGVTFLARWPSRKAMQHARDRIRFMTMRARLAAPVEQVVWEITCSCAAGRAISATATPPTPSIRSDATR